MTQQSHNIHPVEAKKFLELSARFPVFDVRTEAEFLKGHIPGAHHLPLFTNEERAAVGTTYKHHGREAAILEGLDYVGPRMSSMVSAVGKISRSGPVLLHCWRGGMRSSSVAWLLAMFGYEVYLLEGGYKAYRQLVLEQFEIPRRLLILSGSTGSGKTDILKYLCEQGEPVIDLEALANHKGSSFGALGEEAPPTQQQFENMLAGELLRTKDAGYIWLEDESRNIGARVIPLPFWTQMRTNPVLLLRVPMELRVERLTEQYGSFDRTGLQESIEKLSRRIGDQNTRKALDALDSGDLRACCTLLLECYYDPTYLHGLSKRDHRLIHVLESETGDCAANGRELLKLARRVLRQHEALATMA